ncbi:Rv1355c family protein [Nocardia sp. NPDC004340]
MIENGGSEEHYRPILLDESDPEHAARLADLLSDSTIEVRDLRADLRAEFASLVAPPEIFDSPESDRWAYYPWRRAVVALPGPRLLRTVRLDRNRNNLTRAEQEILGTQAIGVVGQSVGHAVAHVLAMEGTCGLLRLADFDTVELSNLNRLPGTLFDLGANKAVVAARRIAELDPYLPVEIFPTGVDEENIEAFLTGLDIVVEECDSFDMKLAVREGARRLRLPLVMHSSDRGLLDVERFDLEPEREPFHGLLGGVTAAELRGLSTRDKTPLMVRILDGRNLSATLAASMVEIGETLNSWPQLASDVQLGGSNVAAAVRRIGLGQELRSGRTRVDIEKSLDEIVEPELRDELVWPDGPDEQGPRSGVEAVLECAQRAPSGGNAQPWTLRADADAVTIALAAEHSSMMDIGRRGSALAVGAALFNARAAAAAHGMLGESELRTGPAGPLTAVLRWGSGADRELSQHYRALLDRRTNRGEGTGAPIPVEVVDGLRAVATRAGATLHLVTDRPGIESAARMLAESERTRYLTRDMHAEMTSELRWPGDDLRTGMDLRTLDLRPDGLAKLEIAIRPDVMAHLRSWSGGTALVEDTLTKLRSSSAVAALTFPRPELDDPSELVAYAQAGEALQRVWIAAEQSGLAVQPVSPVFLYARRPGELHTVSPEFADTLTSLQGRFLELLEVPGHETMALVLRLGYASEPAVRSGRRRIPSPGMRGE